MTAADIREYVELACHACEVPELATRIVVRWNPRFTVRMGDARWLPVKNQGVIRLSVPLWPKASEEERIETVIHEACHVIAAFKHGPGQGHGRNWRALMQLCGYANANRCHEVDKENIVERRRQSQVTAVCGCPTGVRIGPMQARRIRSGAKYRCRRCGSGVVIP